MKDHTSAETATTTAKNEEDAMLLQAELAAGLSQTIGMHAPIAHTWAGLLTDFLRQRLGSQRIYIPAPSRAQRDAAIYQEHDGTNTGALCARYNVSRPRLYQICHEQRELARKKAPV